MTTNLTEGPVARHLRRQATPMAMGLLAIISFDAVDLFFVSRLGEAPLAAISFCYPVIWLLSSIGIGFEAGAASCVSRAVGAGDIPLARRLTTDSVLLSGSVALALCLLGLSTIRPVFALLGATDELMPLIRDYMGIWYWVEPASIVMWTALASIRARGNTLLEGKVIVAAAALNAVLDPIMIFGLLGFPALGMRGAALASLVANLVMLSFTVYYLHTKLRVFAHVFAPLSQINASWRRILQIGFPAAITHAIVPIANGIIVAMLAGFGVHAVAGFGIAMRIESIAMIPFYSLSAVSSPFAGQNFAAMKFSRVLAARNVLLRFSLGYGLALIIAMTLLAWPLSGIFTDTDDIRRSTVSYLLIVSISYGAYGLVMSIIASFNGIGNPLPSVTLSASRALILFLPLALAGRAVFGYPGIFAAATVANLAVGLWAFLWFGRRIRRESETFN